MQCAASTDPSIREHMQYVCGWARECLDPMFPARELGEMPRRGWANPCNYMDFGHGITTVPTVDGLRVLQHGAQLLIVSPARADQCSRLFAQITGEPISGAVYLRMINYAFWRHVGDEAGQHVGHTIRLADALKR